MTQLSYRDAPSEGMAGTPYDTSPEPDVVTGIHEGAAAEPGIAVVQGAVARGVKAPTATGQITQANFRGVVQLDSTRTNPGTYAAGERVPVQRDRRIRVLIETDVAVLFSSPVFIRHAANGAGKLVLGAFRADADGGNATAAPWLRFYQGDNGGVAVVQL